MGWSSFWQKTQPVVSDSYTTQDVNSNTVLSAYDGYKLVRVDTSGGAVDLTLHSATSWNGKLEIITIDASNTLTIKGTVNGVVDPTLTVVNEGMVIVADGAGNFVTPDQLIP